MILTIFTLKAILAFLLGWNLAIIFRHLMNGANKKNKREGREW